MVEISPRIPERLEKARYVIFITITSLIAFGMAFVWYMSPLGIGFIDKPSSPWVKILAENLYLLSYYIGIPSLIAGQAVSVGFYVFKRRSAAYRVPLITISAFMVLAALVLMLFSV